jgi:glycerol uptake facilitator-like aquaporin
MKSPEPTRAGFAEFLGGLLLAAAVVGSGIMAERMAGGNSAVALLANTLATVSMLALLIATLGPHSGAHFNPVVTLIVAVRDRWSIPAGGMYLFVQITGCCLGAMLANLMFEMPAVSLATQVRSGWSQWLGEFVATAGLVFIALTSSPREAVWRVPAWIGAAYWFTSSTSFANPAITVARSLSDSFAGIRVADVPAFLGAQLAGGLAGVLLMRALPPVRRAT